MTGENKWLVKSSDIILGPFEFDRVVEQIFSGEIHLLDEIKGPFERWRPIKDHSLFAAAIEKLKASTYSARENTMTATVDLGTKTHDLTNSQTLSGADESTPSKTPVFVESVQSQAAAPVAYEPYQAPTYQTQGASKSSRRFPVVFLLSFILLLVLGGGYLIYEFKQTKLIEQKISAYDQFTDLAIEALRAGEYREALKNFKAARNINATDDNLIIEMAPLLVQFDGQFNQVESSLESLLVSTRQKTLQKMAHNIIGLTHSYRSRYDQALSAFDSAIQLDDQFLPAQVNKAFVLIKTNKYPAAVELMKKVVADNSEKSIAHFMYIRSLVELGLHRDDPTALGEALSVADQFSQRFSDFKQEVLFLMAVARLKLGSNPEEIKVLVKNFLKVDIALTDLHVHDTLIDFQSFNWVDFVPHCENLQSQLDDYYQKLLGGFCLLKINRTLEAKKILEELIAIRSNDGLLQALKTSVLFDLNQISDAKNSLGFINQVDQKQPLVETILRGCLVADDLSCGEAVFRGQHAKHVSLLYSLWGNSAVLIHKNRRKARASVNKGLKVSPNFAPLVKINRNF